MPNPWLCLTIATEFPPLLFPDFLLKKTQPKTKTFFGASLLILHVLSKVSVRSREQPVGSVGLRRSDRLAVACFSLAKTPSVAPGGWTCVADSCGGGTHTLQACPGYIGSVIRAFEACGYSLLLNCEMDPASSCFAKTRNFSFCAPTRASVQDQPCPAWSLPLNKMYVHVAGGF